MYICECMYVCTVCMYVCMYIYTRTLKSVGSVFILGQAFFTQYVCMYVCMYVYMYICMYVCMYVCTYICMYVCVCVFLLSASDVLYSSYHLQQGWPHSQSTWTLPHEIRYMRVQLVAVENIVSDGVAVYVCFSVCVCECVF